MQKAIQFFFFALAVVTPFLFTTQTSELFEVPKMLFVYLGATAISALTLAKFALERRIALPGNIIFIIFIIFIITQAASTAGSIDKFTSVFGYPSRLNGGLLSNFAYFAVLAGALANLTPEAARKLILALTASAFAVSLWGIPAHFGYDPNCLVLTGNLNSSCWQKEFDPTLRIFSTLGQPNWLASYLILSIPISLALALSFKNMRKKYMFFAVSAVLVIALIFTNSRAGFLGLGVSLLAFLAMLGLSWVRRRLSIIFITIIIFIITLATFGSDLTGRFLEILKAPGQNTGGTESGQIRLIVWQGALEVLKQNPIAGTGPETFAYSYYKVRPASHNQTTEWNFFYNKAHNEILNIFANTGILGGTAYLAFLAAVLLAFLKGAKSPNNSVFAKAGAASLIGYQTSIFFGFSTVTSQLVMFLQIAAVLVLTNQNPTKVLNLKFVKKPFLKVSLAIIAIFAIWALTFIARLYLADIFITRAKEKDPTNSQTLLTYTNAINTSPVDNPFYLADAAYSFAAQSFAAQADALAQRSQRKSAQNVLVARRLASTYILLFATDPKYEEKTEELASLTVDLAPTDPQSYVSGAKVYIAAGQNQEAKESLEKALELKSDYVEALELLDSVNKQLTNID